MVGTKNRFTRIGTYVDDKILRARVKAHRIRKGITRLPSRFINFSREGVRRIPLASLALTATSTGLITVGLMGYLNQFNRDVSLKENGQEQEQKVEPKNEKPYTKISKPKYDEKKNFNLDIDHLKTDIPEKIEELVKFIKVLPENGVYTIRLDNENVCKIIGQLSNPNARYHLEAMVETDDFSSFESTGHSDVCTLPHGVYKLSEEIDGQLHEIDTIDATKDVLKVIQLKEGKNKSKQLRETVRHSNKQLEVKSQMLDEMFKGKTGVYDNDKADRIIIPDGYERKPHPYENDKFLITPKRWGNSNEIPESRLDPNAKYNGSVISEGGMTVVPGPNGQPILYK